MSTKSPKSPRSDQVRYEVHNQRTVAGPSRGKSNSPLPRPQLRPAHNHIQWAPTRPPGGYSKQGSVADTLHLMGGDKKNTWEYNYTPPYAFTECRETLPVSLPFNRLPIYYVSLSKTRIYCCIKTTGCPLNKVITICTTNSLENRSGAHIITGEVTRRSHIRDRENRMMSQERNPVRRKTQCTLLLCSDGGFSLPRKTTTRRVARGPLLHHYAQLVLTLKSMHFVHTVHLITALHFISA